MPRNPDPKKLSAKIILQIAYNSQIRLFWAGIIGQQIFWTILLLAAVFRLKLGWFVITVIAWCLNGSNLYG